jgi:hypothetical protein
LLIFEIIGYKKGLILFGGQKWRSPIKKIHSKFKINTDKKSEEKEKIIIDLK